MDKFDILREAGTDGANYDLDTDAVIEHLKGWDAQYGISVSDAESDTVIVHFERLPKDTMPLARDIYEFCPDVIDQGFGLYEAYDDLPDELAELSVGVDFKQKDFGLELLSRSLSKHETVALWWD